MRPVPFSADAVIFELRDGRVGTKRANLTRAAPAPAPATPDSLLICHCRCVAICMNQTMEVERGLSNYLCLVWFRSVQLAELRRPPSAEGCGGWEWSRIIGTPASACMTSYWTAVAT